MLRTITQLSVNNHLLSVEEGGEEARIRRYTDGAGYNFTPNKWKHSDVKARGRVHGCMDSLCAALWSIVDPPWRRFVNKHTHAARRGNIYLMCEISFQTHSNNTPQWEIECDWNPPPRYQGGRHPLRSCTTSCWIYWWAFLELGQRNCYYSRSTWQSMGPRTGTPLSSMIFTFGLRCVLLN